MISKKKSSGHFGISEKYQKVVSFLARLHVENRKKSPKNLCFFRTAKKVVKITVFS